MLHSSKIQDSRSLQRSMSKMKLFSSKTMLNLMPNSVNLVPNSHLLKASTDVKPPAGAKPKKFVVAKYSSTSEDNTSQGLSKSMKDKIRAEYLAVSGSPNKPFQSTYFLNIILVVAALIILSYFLAYLS